LTGDILVIEICQKMHWDYYTFQAQPIWFIEMIIEKMKIDGIKEKQKSQQKI